MSEHKLLLATESDYKIILLSRLGITFESCAPHIDETPFENEQARALSRRLATTKAMALRAQYCDHIILAADQSAGIGDLFLGKPGTEANAVKMLTKLSGQCVLFHTSIYLYTPNADPKLHTETVTVRMRCLSQSEIIRYVATEQPLDCAGSFKVEQLGISLFNEILSLDPTALEGLPLVKVSQWLRELEFQIP
ncbi:Maf family protein [Litorivicinus sp.]|nr:Maf family protein [Litorivicinus sp.]